MVNVPRWIEFETFAGADRIKVLVATDKILYAHQDIYQSSTSEKVTAIRLITGESMAVNAAYDEVVQKLTVGTS